MGRAEYSIKVNGIPAGTSRNELTIAFASKFATITDIYLPVQNSQSTFGFVRFSSPGEAKEAASSGTTLGGSVLRCELATAKARQKTPAKVEGDSQERAAAARSVAGYSLRVGVLPRGTTTDHLVEAFADHGVVTMTDVHMSPKGDYGFVCFSTEEAALTALQAAWFGITLGGSVLRCELATAAKARQKTPSKVEGDSQERAAAARSVAGYSLRVGVLPRGTTTDHLVEAFADHGVVTMTDVHMSSKGDYGFVCFPTEEAALTALQECAGLQVKGTSVVAKCSTLPKISTTPSVFADAHAYFLTNTDAPPVLPEDQTVRRTSAAAHGVGGRCPVFSVKVGNLPIGTSSADLDQVLASLALDSVADIYIPPGKRYGFVRFRSGLDAQRALELQGMDINGRRITCEIAMGGKQSPKRMFQMSGALGPEASIKVGNLPYGVTQDELRQCLRAPRLRFHD